METPHFARNLLGLVGAGQRMVCAATTREQALGEARAVADRWRATPPKVAEALEEELEECLTGRACARPTGRRGSTTN